MATKCPECNSKIILASINGYLWDVVCSQCGLVLDTVTLEEYNEENYNVEEENNIAS